MTGRLGAAPFILMCRADRAPTTISPPTSTARTKKTKPWPAESQRRFAPETAASSPADAAAWPVMSVIVVPPLSVPGPEVGLCRRTRQRNRRLTIIHPVS